MSFTPGFSQVNSKIKTRKPFKRFLLLATVLITRLKPGVNEILDLL